MAVEPTRLGTLLIPRRGSNVFRPQVKKSIFPPIFWKVRIDKSDTILRKSTVSLNEDRRHIFRHIPVATATNQNNARRPAFSLS